MKNILMITACVATLVAAASFASAQGLNEHRDPPAAAASEQKAPAGKTDHKSESMKPAPTAQAPDKPTGGKSETVGQGSGTQPAPHNAQTPSEHTAPNEAARAELKPGAPAALSTEHHARFRDTIRSERTAPLNDVRFPVTIGEVVPQTVHLNRLPAPVLEYAPQYRGYEYILVGDDILIVDPGPLKILAVIAA